MVAMTTPNVILKNGGVLRKSFISQLLLIIEHLT